MSKFKHFFFIIIVFHFSVPSLAQLDSVYHQGPSTGSVSSGAIQTTDNFGNQPIFGGEPKVVPNPKSPFFEPLFIPTDKSSLPPYVYIEDSNANDDPEVIDDQTVLLRKFHGIPMTDYIPPDPIIAAGPHHVITCVNSQFNIWDKEGNLLKVIPAGEWWSPVWPDEAGDPQVIYDHYAGRWVLTWMQVNMTTLTAGNLISYSDDDNPLGIWYMYRLDTKKHGTVNSNTWGDYPQIGFDDQAIYLTTRCFAFSGSYNYNKIRILKKTELYGSNGGTLTYKDFWNIRQPLNPSFVPDGIRPSYSYTAGEGGYFFVSNSSGGNYYIVYKIISPVSTSARLRGSTLNVQVYYNTPDANQLGGGMTISSNGSGIKTAPIIRDGKMYITHSIGNSTNPVYASIKYLVYSLTSNSILEQSELGAIGYYYIYPTIAVDKDHNIAVTFSRSANTEYIGGYYSTKHANNPSGLSPSQPLAEGQGNYVVTFGGSRNRWGDYLGIFLDPNEYDVWLFPEYAAATNTWGTYVGQIRMASYQGAHIFANPTEINFGDVQLGEVSETFSAIIANYGDADLIISDIQLSIGDFNRLTNLTFPYILSSYDSLMLQFNFTPTDTGLASVIYSIISNDPSFTGFAFNGNGTSAQTFPLTVNVTNGWNMVSIPGLHPTDQNVETWWAHRTGTVWGFNGVQYVAKTIATPGEGYWMKNTVAETYNYPAIQIVPHNPVPVTIGWNLIGGYETSPTIVALKAANPQITGTVWGFNGVQYVAANNIVPGYGYWVKVTAAGNITIPDALAKGNEVVELFKEGWGRIILTDAAGLSYTLYAVKGDSPNGGASVDLDQYEMPPLPPAGSFDIRFSSGRIAEDLNSAVKTIDMSGITYPLTVRVEGMDIRLQDETGKTVNVNLKSGEDVVISDATIQKLMVSSQLIPEKYALEQNYPNPFNPSTVIEFSLPENVGNVRLSIYNALGEKVAELVNTALTAGKYQYQWNAQNVATGMYIYELRTDKFVSTKKMIMLK